MAMTKRVSALVDGATKGFPPQLAPTPIEDIGGIGWRLLDGDLPLPVAILHEDRVRRNSQWMSAFARRNGFLLAPHGKTTMAPWLFDLQIADGAWAITLATVQQMQVARRHGVKRVLLANQPTGRLAIDACFQALADDEHFELYCLVDSEEGVASLSDGARRIRPSRPLRVLLEMGFPGGRTGCRSLAQALRVARVAAQAEGVALAGVEAFEGILPSVRAVNDFLATVVEAAQQTAEEDLFAKDGPIILSAGGSAFFDCVVPAFAKAGLKQPTLKVLRSGCYVTHDDIAYKEAALRVASEGMAALPPGALEPALEVWAYVQSRPDADKAILTMGKRDVGFDSGLPLPKLWHRPGTSTSPQRLPAGHATTALNDQHCHLALPPESPLAVGDMVGFGIGHPCTTFDKWSALMLVDPDYRVTGAIRTYF